MNSLTAYEKAPETAALAKETALATTVVAAYLEAQDRSKRIRNANPVHLALLMKEIHRGHYPKTELEDAQLDAIIDVLNEFPNVTANEVRSAFTLAAAGRFGDLFLTAHFTPTVVGKVLCAYAESIRTKLAAGQRQIEMRMEREAANNRRMEPFEWPAEKLARFRTEIRRYAENLGIVDMPCNMFWADLIRPLVADGVVQGPVDAQRKKMWEQAKNDVREFEMDDRKQRMQRGQLVRLRDVVHIGQLTVENFYAIRWCHAVIELNKDFFTKFDQ
jgi:hypothetical protein